MDDLVGQRLGRYRVDRLLGSGGMGAVYAGVQLDLGRPVAIKVLRPELSMDASIAQRFKREAEIAASLHHPHSAQVTDFGVEDGRPFLVMDLLEGESLGALLEREGALDEARVRRIALQILAALASAHERGVVHRDLKPENVFVQHTSGMDLVKLLDFGIARVVDADAQMTKTGAVLGTPAYMSPEQARGRAVDARSDVFSLGAVLYEALSGRRAFDGANHHELLFAVVEQTPPPLSEVAPATSAELAAIVERAMSKDASARFASASEMRAAIEGEANTLPLGGATPPPRERSQAAFANTVASDPGSPRTPEPPVAARPSRRWLPYVVLGIGISIAASAWGALEEQLFDPPSAASPAPIAGVEPTPSLQTPAPQPPAPQTPAPQTPAPQTPASSDPPLVPLAPRAEAPPPSAPPAPSDPPDEEEHDAHAPSPAAGRMERCSGSPREMFLMTGRTNLRYSGLNPRGFRHTDAPAVRARAAEIAPRIARCFRGRYTDTSVDFDLSVAAGGEVTSVRTYQFCPLDPAAARCAEGVVSAAFPHIDGEGSGVLRVSFARTQPRR